MGSSTWYFQQEADVVLYLVNATEEPNMAGYIAPELQLLEWIGKPVIVLLNLTGPPKDREDQERLERPWKEYFGRYGFVRGVHSLDAFSRCWVQEGILFETIRSMLPAQDRQLMDRLFNVWQNTNLDVFYAAMEQWAVLVSWAARSQVMTSGDGSPMDVQKQQAVDGLLKGLVNEVGATTKAVIALHGLEGDAIGVIQARMDHVDVQRGSEGRGDATLSGAAVGGIGGALTSGAYAGLRLSQRKLLWIESAPSCGAFRRYHRHRWQTLQLPTSARIKICLVHAGSDTTPWQKSFISFATVQRTRC